MKIIEFAAYVNDEGSHHERTLATANVHTATDFRQLLAEALDALCEVRSDEPDCPLFIFINGEKIDEFDTAELIVAASEDDELSDDAKIEEFLK
jgi:hypothetical protein